MEIGIVAVKLATPDALVVPEPTDTPFNVKLTVLPLTNVAPASDVRVADRDTDPPGVPLRELSLEVAMMMGPQADPLVPLLIRILRQPREARTGSELQVDGDL